MMSFETIEELVAYQRQMELEEIHLVHFCDDLFFMAHTDQERDLRDRFPAAMPLEDCELHCALAAEPGQPVPDGTYLMLPVREGDERKYTVIGSFVLIPWQRANA